MAIWEEYFRFLLHFLANHGSYAHLFGRVINFIIPIIIQGSLGYPFGGHQAMHFCGFPLQWFIVWVGNTMTPRSMRYGIYMDLLGQWLNFKLFGSTYLVGPGNKVQTFLPGSIG